MVQSATPASTGTLVGALRVTQQRHRTIPRRPPSESDGLRPPSDGVVFNSQPDFEIPDLPRDITSVSDQALMRLFSEYVAWQNYAATQLVEHEVEETRAEADVRRISAER